MSSTPATPTASTSESLLQKIWAWITKEATAVEAGVEEIIGTKAAQDLEAIAKGLITGAWGPFVAAALADATDVATGQMNIGTAISSLISLAKAEGKTLTQQAALQLIALGQNALPANPQTVTLSS